MAANNAETKAHDGTRNALFELTKEIIAELLSTKNQGTHEKLFLRKMQAVYEEFVANQGDTPRACRDKFDGHVSIGHIRQRLGAMKEAEAEP